MQRYFRISQITRQAHILLLLLAASMLGACASPAEMQNMTVDQSELVAAHPNTPFKHSLAVARVDGGEDTNPLWTSEVSGDAYKGALETSLENSGLLAEPHPSARFDLYAILTAVNQPLIGLDLTVSSQVDYRVVERSTNKTWFEESILAAYTATFSDSPLAVQRLRFANEGSIRENIKQFIEKLLKQDSPVN